MSGEGKNKLYFGDNLDILRNYLDDETVDLIYLDPPFNSQSTYNVLFAEKSGEKSEAQITAFEDTWHWGLESESTYRDVIESGPQKLASLLEALRGFLGTNDMMAYIVMLAPRLIELHRVLKTTGVLFLHCDPTASHFIKLILDSIFGPRNFRNEIIWRRTRAHNDRNITRFGANHDTIFFYSKSNKWLFNRTPTLRSESAPKTHDLYLHTDGKLYRKGDCRAPGGRGPRFDWNGHVQNWRFTQEMAAQLEAEGRIVYSKTGMPRVLRPVDPRQGPPLQDTWFDIDPPNSGSDETLGYPTQKPEALLERIIKSSSKEGDLILDPFCGCGTTIAVAERLQRRWIGVDITHLAISLMRHRLHDVFGSTTSPHAELAPYVVIGDPKDLESARALAQEVDRYDFQFWAVGLVDGFPAQNKKKGADRGIDGFINFFDDDSGKVKKLLIQVKSGHVSSRDIRDLVGVLEREKAQIGAFITLEEPSEPMRVEAISAGFYEPEHYKGQRFPRVQLLTIADLLAIDGKRVAYPEGMGNPTFRKARRRQKKTPEQTGLF